MNQSQINNAEISAPCPYFSKCGGCDFLDLSEENYQKLKQSQIKEEAEWIWVGAASRRKIILQIAQKNVLGFFAKKSKEIVEIESCFVAEKAISEVIPKVKSFLQKQEQNLFTQVAVTLFDNGLDLVFVVNKEPSFTQLQKIITFAKEQNFNASYKIKNHVTPIFLARKNQIVINDVKIDLSSEIFIQATKSGLQAIIKIIRDFLNEKKTYKNIADIYAGFGAYSFAIPELTKSITAFEGDKKMVDMISKNAASNQLSHKIKAVERDLFAIPLNAKELKDFDLVIINPPRNGASPQILEIAKSNLKNIIYVSCNPESFWRDAKILEAQNFKITKLFALDQFYSTKHLELIAIFTR